LLEKAGFQTSAAVVSRIFAAFEQGTGYGLLHLGAVELDSKLSPSLAFWRSLGRLFVNAVCGMLNPMEPEKAPSPEPNFMELDRLACKIPPMYGAELLSRSLLLRLWAEMAGALVERTAEYKGGLQAYLNASHSNWHVVGRISLHLAENKRDPNLPFAFIAAYVRQPPDRATLQYLPLSRALQEYAGKRNKQKLLSLLTPLQQAAEQSELMRALLNSGDIYHPLAWSVEEAYRFLCEAEHFERSGLVLRLPDWWQAKRRTHPQVEVLIGTKSPSIVSGDALLDFDLRLSLGGEALTSDEINTILEASAGLVLIKGRWVEVDPKKLKELLNHWRTAQSRFSAEGLSFIEAMRLLSGAEFEPKDPGSEHRRSRWSKVVAGEWFAAQLEAIRAPEILEVIDQNAGLQAQLRPYQKVGVQWLWNLRALGLGGCLADDMGLGKTIQVIALLSMLQNQKRDEELDLLVVPASLLGNWQSELKRFAPNLRALIAHPSKIPSRKLKVLPSSALEGRDLIITTYGTVLRTPWIQGSSWRSVILDEAQAIKNPSAKQTQVIKKLSARWRLALTGTPVENRLGDLWSLFDFLNPGLLGSAALFKTFCKSMESNTVDGFAPLRRLIGPYLLRRLKSDKQVISDLPDKSEINAYCLLSKHQAALYKQSVKEMRTALEESDGIKRRGVVLAFLMRFKQICNHPSQWLGDADFKANHSGKFQRLLAICEPIAERQEKVLIFTQFRVMIEPLRDLLSACFDHPGVVLHGGTPVKQRAGLVQRFQEDEELPFMVLSLKAGGAGLNLTAANHIIHFDRWWNPAVENQATDRAFRIGQKRNVLVQKFICKGTVEERIDKLITHKQRLSDSLLSGTEEVKLTELSDDELLELVNLDLQSAVIS